MLGLCHSLRSKYKSRNHDQQNSHNFSEALPRTKTMRFDKTFFLILNLALGADCLGNPDSTTRFPQTTQVDYVGVYQLFTSVPSACRNTHG